MEKIKNFFKKYGAEIIIILGAISAVLTQLQTEQGITVWGTITIAIIAVLVEILKNGVSEKAITLLTKAIEIIIKSLSGEPLSAGSVEKVSDEKAIEGKEDGTSEETVGKSKARAKKAAPKVIIPTTEEIEKELRASLK